MTCPGNILSDISRLEVLIGGARAGNNSIEIINEAADICRRLFAGDIMDIDVYRELIDELVENHRDAHGYMDFSDSSQEIKMELLRNSLIEKLLVL